MSTPATSTAPSADAQTQAFRGLMQMITGYWVSQCLYVAAKLGIADLLEDGPKPVSLLAERTATHPDHLYRVLRALAGVGVFAESEHRTFSQTPLSALLASEAPGSMRWMAMMMGEEHYQVWGRLLETLKRGDDNAFEVIYGSNFFDYLETHPESAETFNRAMTGFASGMHSAVVAQYDFSGFKSLVDVGGGHGALISGILERYPQLNGVLFDLPHVVSGAESRKARLGDRLSLVGGDFFKSVHPGGDAYILSTVIHDWSDELSVQILKNIHQAMPDGGTLLLVENVVEPDNRPSPAKFLDINMLVMTVGGRERSSEEWRELCEAAGFELSRIIPTSTGICVIEGKKR